MRILVYIPQSRVLTRSLMSIHDLDTSGHEVAFFFDKQRGEGVERWDRVTSKYRDARRIALAMDVDALFCIEDDIIIPPDALQKLLATEADIAYGLTVCRPAPHHWAIHTETGPDDSRHSTFSHSDRYQKVWGRVVDCVGCGLYCTIIRQSVIKALDFERRGSRCCDWYLAIDAQKAGFTQRCDTSVVCGHIMDNGSVLYPSGGANHLRIEEGCS